jgi:type IV fimbrial biogenesis protein FimT
VADQRLRVETDALFHAVHLARKSSIARRHVVSLCPSIDGRSCNPGYDWSDGWIMFANTDRDDPPQVDANEPIIKRHLVDDRVQILANRQGFTLRSTQFRATNGTFVICDRAQRTEPRGLVVSYTGRPRMARSDSRGNGYRCAD